VPALPKLVLAGSHRSNSPVGASFSNIVKLNTYIVDIGTNIAHYREVRDKFVNTWAPPASTAIGVPQLARPEVEAIAVLPPT
jgi:enamine deaminase RidA (YjgF/YER057c/UK114 family)